MNTTFKRIISMALICMMMIGTLAGFSVSADEAATTVEIVSNNVQYGESLKLMYAVKAPAGSNVKVTITDAQGNVYNTVADGTVTVDGVECYKFVSEYGVPAQNIDAQFTATATVEGTEASDSQTYSVLQYLWHRLNVSTNTTDVQRAMYNALIEYAKAADVVLNKEAVSSIANLTYVVINGEGAMYNVGDEVELITDLVAGEGQEIVWTLNGETYTEATYVVTNAFANFVATVAGDVVEPEEPTPEEPTPSEMTIPEVNAAADNTEVIVTGTVISADAWSEQHGNMTVTIQDEQDNTLYVYRMATQVEVGDIIVVTGTKTTYNGNVQIAAGATAEIIGHEDVAGPEEITIADALLLPDGSSVIVTGAVCKINTPWDSGYGNISVTIVDENGDELYLYRLATNVALGDVITVTGNMATYGGARQIAAKATAEILGAHNCEDYASEATCTAASTCFVCDAELAPALVHPTDENSDGFCDNCGLEVSISTTVVKVVIADYADANSWSNSKQYGSLTMDANITVTATGGSNTGKYYTSGENWRIYQNESPAITVTAANGKTIVSVKITYASQNTGVLTLEGTNVVTGTVVEVNGDSITFSVGNTGTATNGQVRITAIEVVYQ